MGFENEKDAETRRKSEHPSATGTPVRSESKKKKGPGGSNVGQALRSAYQRTIDEQIPPDLLDLLGKLG